MIPGIFGLPTIDGKHALGASSPATPALHIPEPLSITTAGYYSSAILIFIEEILNFFKNSN